MHSKKVFIFFENFRYFAFPSRYAYRENRFNKGHVQPLPRGAGRGARDPANQNTPVWVVNTWENWCKSSVKHLKTGGKHGTFYYRGETHLHV